jgi:hypothetical protein
MNGGQGDEGGLRGAAIVALDGQADRVLPRACKGRH